MTILYITFSNRDPWSNTAKLRGGNKSNNNRSLDSWSAHDDIMFIQQKRALHHLVLGRLSIVMTYPISTITQDFKVL